MHRLFALIGLLLASPAAVMSLAPSAFAQDEIKTERVSFGAGQSSTVINRTIRGREIVDLLVNARKGQRLVVSMTSSNTAAYFNLIAPGGENVAFYAGTNSDPVNSYTGYMPESGDLKIRAYLYRAAARRGERADVRISLSVTGPGDSITQLPGNRPGQGGSATQLPGDALVPGTHYNATGRVSCIARINGPVGDCRFGVIRLGGRSASVTITKLDNRTRTIIYRDGVPVGFDQGPGEPGRLSWRREGSQTTVNVGGERYFIPDAVIFGG